MPRLEWMQRWETGDAKIDLEHRMMVEGYNRLQEAREAGAAEPEVKRALSFLLVYVETHFQNEEAVMERLGYPFLAEHIAEHRECTRRINHLLECHRNAGEDVVEGLGRFFKYWLVEHFEVSDRQWAAYAEVQTAG